MLIRLNLLQFLILHSSYTGLYLKCTLDDPPHGLRPCNFYWLQCALIAVWFSSPTSTGLPTLWGQGYLSVLMPTQPSQPGSEPAYRSARVLSRFSRVWLFVIPWTVARHAPLSVGFSRQEYWSGCYSLLQRIFPAQGSNPGLPHCRQIPCCLSHQGMLVLKCVQRM